MLGAVVGKKKYFCHAGRDLLLNTWKKDFVDLTIRNVRHSMIVKKKRFEMKSIER